MNKFKKSLDIVSERFRISLQCLSTDMKESKLKHLNLLKEACEEADEHIHLRQLIETGDIFSPQEFYDEYESCLKGEGIAVFIMKDLSINSDFKTCWSILENCVDKYNIFDRYECQIAFIIWFNR